MLRSIGGGEPVTLVHGRFQPPHEGHFELIRQAPTDKVVVSIDVRSPDIKNPYSFNFRKAVIKSVFPTAVIIPHYIDDCVEPIVFKIYEGVKNLNIKAVLGGPQFPEEAKIFWRQKNIPVIKMENRFFNNISGTEVRKRNISIITNFGCENNCWYCVWKRHKLRNGYQNTDWSFLRLFLEEHLNKHKVSISGGGDPLYNFENNKIWWTNLFNITDKKIDIHTRKQLYNDEFWKKINRVSFSSDRLSDCSEFLKYVSKFTNVRIVHVVTKNSVISKINEYKKFVEENGFQLTLKKLSGYNDSGMFDYLSEKFDDVFFLDGDDYNIYYMPDNTVRAIYQF